MLTAADIMTSQVITIRGAQSVAEAVEVMRKNMVSALLVDRRHPRDAYGIITVTDIIWKVIAYGKNPKQMKVYEIMSKPCISVNPDLGVEYVARLFSDVGIRCAPVIQGDKVGMISVTDLFLKTDFVENPTGDRLELQLKKAVKKAGTIASEKGINTPDSREAWREVADIQAELSHQTTEIPEQYPFEEYLEEHPSSVPKDEYEFLLDGYMGF